jgi:hypothetical protein
MMMTTMMMMQLLRHPCELTALLLLLLLRRWLLQWEQQLQRRRTRLTLAVRAPWGNERIEAARGERRCKFGRQNWRTGSRKTTTISSHVRNC